MFFTLVVFSSCSLKYSQTVNAEDSNPEFVFENTHIVRYENGKETMDVKAENIEQYKNSSVSYGKNVEFTAYNDKQEIETEGQCGLLYADTDAEMYELYDGIQITDKSQNTNFSANMLRWNGKTEQLTGGRRDTVKVEKDNTVIYGTGFSASGISRKFVFSGTVSGEIETKDEQKEVTE